MAPVQPQEWLAAVAVAGIAFWAPSDESGYLTRIVAAIIALGTLLLASIALQMLMEYRQKASEPQKANIFEVQVRKKEVPTAPPGGVFGAASNIASLLDDFPVDINSRVTTTENGFQVITGVQKLRVKVAAGTAIGWEFGSPCWVAKRDEWIEAVQAAPRCSKVMSTSWMGVTSLAPAEEGEHPLEAGATVVKIDGIASKPQLNGKLGVVTSTSRLEEGRIGVRPEGQKEGLWLPKAKVSALVPFDRTGVSVPCLRSFRAELQPLLDGLTLAEAINSVIKPLTANANSSVAAALARKGAKDEAGIAHTKPATVFLCCASSSNVNDLMDIIERHAATQPKVEDVYVWFDLLCSNHHAEEERDNLPMLWWQMTFRAGLRAIGQTCLALCPWDDAAPLKSSWCHWQLLCALSADGKENGKLCHSPGKEGKEAKEGKEGKEGKDDLKESAKETPSHVAVGTTAVEDERLREALVLDMEAPMKVLDTRADGWRKGAEAPTAEQQAMIEKAIEKSEGGYEELGRKLADVLHKWLLERAKSVLAALPAEERATSTLVDRTAKLLQDFGDLEAAEPLCREQVESRSKTLGEHHADTLEALNNLALLLHQLGKLEEAEPFSKRKLAGCRAVLGDSHPDTITAIDTTSQLLSDLGKLSEAMPLKRESLADKRRSLGDRHPDTLLSVNNLAVLLNDLGRQTGDIRMLRDAEPLKREALAGCREVLGNRHPHTLASVANLADLLMQLVPADPRALSEAEPLAREALAGTREVLGGGHPETLKSVGMMAALLTEQGHQHPPNASERLAKFREAEPLYKEAVIGFSKGLGQYHPTPLSYQHELTRLLLDMGKAQEAEDKATETVKGLRASMGDSHPETLVAITHLGAVLRAVNKLDAALPLAKEVRQGWKALEGDKGPVPRNTLTSTNILAELMHAMKLDREAEPLCREVLNGFLRAVGPNHPFTKSGAENLSAVLRALGKTDEADKVLKQFGMKTPLGGIGEESENGALEEGDDEAEDVD